MSYSLQMQKYRRTSQSSPILKKNTPQLPQIVNIRNEAKFAIRSRAGSDSVHSVKINQDATVACKFNGFSFYAVFDGHGQNGHLVSSYLRKHLPINLKNTLKEVTLHSEAVNQAIIRACAKTNTDLCRSDIDTNLSGSTMASILIKDNQVYCANVGDSRAILCARQTFWQSLQLSVTHNPQNARERARIVNSDGRIRQGKTYDGYLAGPERVYLQYADTPGLAMTRSFGDKIAAKVGVIAEPEIIEFSKNPSHKFIVLASDGVWDLISNDEVMEFVKPYFKDKQVELATEKIVREAFNRWKSHSTTRDDISSILIFL